MTNNIHQRIKTLLTETNDAFESCGGSMNMDYAAFVSMRLSEFKSLLENPNLDDRELRKMIRSGQKQCGGRDAEGSWASFIAGYMANSINQNLKESVTYGLDKVYEEKP